MGIKSFFGVVLIIKPTPMILLGFTAHSRISWLLPHHSRPLNMSAQRHQVFYSCQIILFLKKIHTPAPSPPNKSNLPWVVTLIVCGSLFGVALVVFTVVWIAFLRSPRNSFDSSNRVAWRKQKKKKVATKNARWRKQFTHWARRRNWRQWHCGRNAEKERNFCKVHPSKQKANQW